MSQTVHDHFLSVAEPLGEPLVQALRDVGPIDFKPDDSDRLSIRLARSVTGQQLSVKAARTIWERVVMAAGDIPLPHFFHEDNIDQIRACGLSGAKTKTVCAIGAACRAGELEADDLRHLSPEERVRILSSLWGVGQWTADMINIFYFGEPDIWPDGDIAARNTLVRLTSPRRKTARTAERFAPYRSFLALYMWRWLDADPNS